MPKYLMDMNIYCYKKKSLLNHLKVFIVKVKN